MPYQEVRVCERLRAFRKITRLSQAEFARQLGVENKRLASYEHAHAPVKYGLAYKAYLVFGLNCHWLFTGDGNPQGNFFVPPPTQHPPGPLENHLFSKEFEGLMLAGFLNVVFDPSKLSPPASFDALSYLVDNFLEDSVSFAMAALRPECVADFLAELRTDLYAILARKETFSKDDIQKRFDAFKQHRSQRRFGGMVLHQASNGGEKETIPFDEVTEDYNIQGLQKPLSNLLERVRTACEIRGKRADLARYLGVHMPSITDWLDERREPSGSTTLRMLEWVTAEEAKQTKSPGSVSAPPEPKTRLRKSSDEKPKTGPP